MEALLFRMTFLFNDQIRFDDHRKHFKRFEILGVNSVIIL